MSEWRDIPGWVGFYRVSDRGEVMSLARVTIRSDGRRQVVPQKILQSQRQKSGHLHVTLYRPGHRQVIRVHSAVAAAFIGPRPAGMQVRHLDGNPQNNRRPNLCYGTPLENSQDTLLHGHDFHANREACPQGHIYDAANTYIDPRGHRKCKRCRRERDARRYKEGKKRRYPRRTIPLTTVLERTSA